MYNAHCLYARQTRISCRDCCRKAIAVQKLASDLHISIQVRRGDEVQLLADQTSALHVGTLGQLSCGQLNLH